jgi:alpha-aminoadipic semialdehyde synthase
VEPLDPSGTYTWEDYRDHPERYRARFGQALPWLTAIVHGILWSPGYPRFILREDLARLFDGPEPPRLRLVTDVTCDPDGSNEALVKATGPGDPMYVFDAATGEIRSGADGDGLVVLAVDILPAELPVDASRTFSAALAPVIPALAAGAEAPDDLPPELRRALLAWRGRLVPPWDGELEGPLREHAAGGVA